MISSLCRGKGKCGKCRVEIKGELSDNQLIPKGINPQTDAEKSLLGDFFNKNIRLACQVIPNGTDDLIIKIIDLSETQDNIFKIQDTFSNFQLEFPYQPRVFVKSLKVPPPTLENSKDDFSRLLIALEESNSGSIDVNNTKILCQLASSLQENDGAVQAVVDRQQNHLFRVDVQKSALLGAVIDVGTTSIVATLVDLETGILLGADSIINPQIEFGRDIMSRLTYALVSPSNQQQLQNEVLSGISELLKALTSTINSSPANIYEIVVVGNSAMHHLFLNLPIIGLSRAPFVPVISKELSFLTKDIDKDKKLKILQNAIVTTPPLVGGFIGSDVVVDVLYTGFDRKNGTHLLIDFGTNSEIVLLRDNKLYAASVAAGGAFEGQHIACGMRGVAGAIEKFQIEKGTYQYQTIQSVKPKGICGTGIIDILAHLLNYGQLDYRGRIFTRSGELSNKLVLVPARETSTDHSIYLTRKDVEAIQKAKAATLAAIRILTTHLQIKLEDIDSVHIAGVFGSKLNINNAKTIGLLPNLPTKQFIVQGNTAEKGGRVFLLSMDARKAATTIARSVERLELTRFPEFQSFFTEGLFFPKI